MSHGPAPVAERALSAARDGGWALVTGGSSGIGLEYAHLLAARRIRCLLLAEDEAALVAAAGELRARHGVEVDWLVVDLADPGFVTTLRDGLAGRPVEILVSNAGFGIKGPFLAAAPADYVRLAHVNALAPALLARELLPAMLERGRGIVVHVASINALAPIPRSAVYSACKAFVLSFATALWHEHRDSPLVFQTLLPGTTATAFHDRQATRLPFWAMSPRAVAQSSIDTLGRDLVHIPGLVNKTLATLGAALPIRLRTAAAGAVLRASLGV
jgi:uncharacterized protein